MKAGGIPVPDFYQKETPDSRAIALLGFGASPMARTILELFKVLPRTNCCDCGQAACLAFATRVIKEGEDLKRCPHLSQIALAMAGEVAGQQASGVGKRRESVAIALEALQAKVAPLDLARVAPGGGGQLRRAGPLPLRGPGLLRPPSPGLQGPGVLPTGVTANPWDAILLYNYLAFQGTAAVTGTWITYQSLPNSVSKTKTLKRLEGELAAHFAGKRQKLLEAAVGLGAEPAQVAEDADLQLAFRPLPKVPVLLLFWEEDPEEHFPAQLHFLFDQTVADFLDLESLLFLVEQLSGRLMAA